MVSTFRWILIIFWSLKFVLSDDENTSICEDKDGLIPHPGECQLFIDCQYTFGQHLFECPYPFLFSAETKRCEWFEYVDCGKRKEPISGCDYRLNQHPSRRPCSMDFPHCEGLPDGANVIEAKIFTPSYAVCYKGRFLFEGKCPNDSTGNLQIFDPNTLKCAPLPW